MAIEVGKVGAGIAPPLVIDDKMATGLTSKVTRLQAVSDGSYLEFPTTTTGTLRLKDVNDAILWQHIPTDINAAIDAWQGAVYLDSVNQKLFLIGVDTLTAPDTHYLASIAISTGIITNIGNFQTDALTSSNPAERYICMTRTTETSGDFTIVHKNKVFVINSTTGALVSEVALSLGGVTTTSVNNRVVGLLSPNGKYLINTVDGSTNNAGTAITVLRVGSYIPVYVPMPQSIISRISPDQVAFKEWGGSKLLLTTFNITSKQVFGSVLFDKVDMFRFIDKYLGL